MMMVMMMSTSVGKILLVKILYHNCLDLKKKKKDVTRLNEIKIIVGQSTLSRLQNEAMISANTILSKKTPKTEQK